MIINGTKNVSSDESLIIAICECTGISDNVMAKAIKRVGSFSELIRRVKGIDTCGLTEVQYNKLTSFITAASLFSSRMVIKEQRKLDSSTTAGEYFAELLKHHDKQEQFILTTLTAQNVVINTTVMFSGSVNESAVYVRNIIEQVIKDGANSVMIAHNHPGNSLSASGPDLDVTRRIAAALKTISVQLLDHFIVNMDGCYASLAEQGLI